VNWLDIVLIVVLGFSTIQSFRKGFSREIIGLAAAIASIVLGMWLYRLAGSYLQPYVNSERVANFAGFAIVVVAVLVLGAVAGWIVSRFVRTVGLSFFDRLLGAAFGFVRGFLVAIALLTGYIAFGPHGDTDSTPGAVVNSRIAPYVLEGSRFAVQLAPMDLKQNFRKHYTKIKSVWEKPSRKGVGEDS